MEGVTNTVMEALTKAVGDVFTLMGTCFTIGVLAILLNLQMLYLLIPIITV